MQPGLRRRAVGGHALLLALILLLAFGLRVVDLENRVHLFVDEMHFSDAVVDLRENPPIVLLSPMNSFAAFTWFYPYLQSLSVGIFGPTLTALRMVSVMFGLLGIAALYFLAVQLFDRPTALLAAGALAVFPPHIHFSRLGLNNIADPLFGVLALAFLARGWRRGGGLNFALAGLMLGLTQYWYEGGKLLYPALMLLWLLGLAWRGCVRWRQVGWVLLGFGLVAAPLAFYLGAAGGSYTPRLDTMNLNNPDLLRALLAENGLAQINQYISTQLNPAWLHLVALADASAFYYGGHSALILPPLLPFFVVGAGVMVWRRCWMPLLWLALAVFGNSLLDTPGWTARYVVLFPALALLLAVGLAWVGRRLAALRVGLSPGRRRLGMALGLAALALFQVGYYFGPHLYTYNQQIRPFRDHQDVMWRSRHFPPGTHVLLFTDELVYAPHFEGMMRYWQIDLNVKSLHPLELLLRSPARLPMGGDLAIFLQPENRELLAFLSAAFDLPPPQYSPYNLPLEKQYALYYIDISTLAP